LKDTAKFAKQYRWPPEPDHLLLPAPQTRPKNYEKNSL